MKGLFTEKDIRQIEAHGLTTAKINAQIDNFRKGFGFLDIDRAASTGDGIMRPDERAIREYTKEYLSAAVNRRIVKFVPASGAATRMFKDLFEFVSTGGENQHAKKTVEHISEFAFYDKIKDKVSGAAPSLVAQAVIDYGAALPKGLLLFHRYREEARTAVEEHLTEGALYASACGQVHIHFTVSKEHKDAFRELVESVSAKYEKRHGVRYTITYSEQSPSTDTIAVTPDNQPFREADGSLLFRPAGHGALIENLDRIDADLVFIKNIDNVTTDRLKGDTVIYKKAMAGLLVRLQKTIFGYLRDLDNGSGVSVETENFIREQLSYRFRPEYNSLPEEDKKAEIRKILDRPLRVCAMVRNEGEPGGGPFWVNNADGSLSLQIGEPSQVSPGQKELLKSGTHFNPVDLICGVRDYKGEKFDLLEYTDPQTGFISEKSKDGKLLRALELPGLWNGAMANWNTVFVEVPVSTFTPVKTVTDLLRPQHQTEDNKN